MTLPRAITVDSFDEAFVLLRCPAALYDIRGHLGKPAFAAVLICAVGNMLCDGMPFGRVWVVGILYKTVSKGSRGR